jgi:hypothetical protein
VADNRDPEEMPPVSQYTPHAGPVMADITRKILEEAREEAQVFMFAAVFLHGCGPKPRLVSWAAEFGDDDGVGFMEDLINKMTPFLKQGEELELRIGEIPDLC